MDPNFIELKFRGVRVIGPESFFCAVMVWEDSSLILPIWLSPIDGAELGERALEEDSGRRRPTTHDVLADVLSRFDGGVDTLVLTSYFEGIFIGEIRTTNGEAIDARASDILILSQILEVPVLIDEEIATQIALRIPDDELDEYLDLILGQDDNGEPASGIDEEFQEMLRDLGVQSDEDDSDEPHDDNGGKQA